MKENLLLLIIFILLHTFSSILLSEEKVEYNNIKINYISNKDLLKKTQIIYDQSSTPFLAELRAVNNNEQKFKNLQNKIENLTLAITQLKKPADNIDADRYVQLLLAYTKQYHKLLKDKETLLLNKKSLITQQISQINSVKLSADVFIQSFDQLNLYLLEIQQRLDDGSLESDKIPSILHAENIKIKQKYAYQQRSLSEDKLTQKKMDLAEYSKQLELFKKQLEQAHAQYLVAEKDHNRVIIRKEIRKNYTDKTVIELQQEYNELYSENHWLKRRSEQAFEHLKINKKALDQQEAALEKQKKKNIKSLQKEGISNIAMLQNLDTNNIQEAEKMSKQVTDFHNERLKILEKIQDKLNTLIETGHSLSTEIAIFQEHLLKSQVLTLIFKELLEQKKIDAEWLKNNNHEIELAEFNKILMDRMAEVLSITKKAEDKKVTIKNEVKSSQKAKEEINEKVANIRKMFASTEGISQWVETLENMDTEKLLTHFKKVTLQLNEKKQLLEKQIISFATVEEEKQRAEKNLSAIKDPLWQVAQKESLNYEREILKKLYQFSGEQVPEKYAQEDINLDESEDVKISSEQDEDKDKNAEKSKKDVSKPSPKTESSNILNHEKQYQDYLSSWLRVIDNQNQARKIFLQSTEKLQKNITLYSNIILETRNIAEKYQADAIELKKRFIKSPDKMQKIVTYELTKNINNALNMVLLDDLDIQASHLLGKKSLIKNQIEKIQSPEKTQKNIALSLKDIEGLESKRIETQLDLDKLKSKFNKERKSLSTLELKSLEQSAWNRLYAENTIQEELVDITPSTQANNLINLLHGYYMELIELSKKGKNIETQIELVNTIISSSQNEKPLLEKIIPLLSEHKIEIERRQTEMEAMIKIALVPEKNELISQQFLDKTGEQLSIPLTLADDEKEQAIEKNAKHLSELHTSLLALDKWITLFQNRLKNTGIDAHIGQYQNMLGKLSSHDTTLKHRIKKISGNSLHDLRALLPEEKPKNSKELRLFLKGKIGVLRDKRYQINKSAIIKLVIKLLSIIFITFLLLKLTNLFFNYLQKRTKDEVDPQNSFVQAFFRTFIRIILWSVAILTLLSSVGFQIGAILAGLGIGGFAIAIAAKETLSNILAGITLFLEKPFKIGDTIKVNDQLPQKVVNMTWRSTQMIDSNSYYSNIPNSVVANATLINYTKNGSSRDYIDIGLSPKYDSETVARIMVQALDKCGDIILQDRRKDVELKGVEIYSETPFIRYRVRFCVANYHSRGGIRDKVLRKVKQQLAESEISIALELRQWR